MRNIQNIALIVLALAVAFLLYKQFSAPSVSVETPDGKIGTTPKKITLEVDSNNTYGAVAFVNTDTLFEKFENFKRTRAAFQKKKDQAEAELGGKMRALEMEYMDIQKKIQAGTMTETLIKDAEQTMMRKQQEIAALREERMGQLMDEEKRLSDKLNDQIFNYMQDYAPRHGLKYVLGYTRGGGILYAADSLDITPAILDGLNEKYQGK
jgi:outer membrane protein